METKREEKRKGEHSRAKCNSWGKKPCGSSYCCRKATYNVTHATWRIDSFLTNVVCYDSFSGVFLKRSFDHEAGSLFWDVEVYKRITSVWYNPILWWMELEDGVWTTVVKESPNDTDTSIMERFASDAATFYTQFFSLSCYSWHQKSAFGNRLLRFMSSLGVRSYLFGVCVCVCFCIRCASTCVVYNSLPPPPPPESQLILMRNDRKDYQVLCARDNNKI